MDSCPGDANVLALVGGGSSGTISLANPDAYQWIDQDPAIPGFNGLRVPGVPGAIAVDAKNSVAYVTLHLVNEIQRIDLSRVLTTKYLARLETLALGFDPQDMILDDDQLLLTDTAGGQVWSLATADYPTGQPHAVQVGGSPAHMTVTQGKIYVSHVHERHVTVLDRKTLKVLTRIGFGPPCSDGIDNDGDGQIDRNDSSCTNAEDGSEGKAAVIAACANGIDDDGDGQTDYPNDLGCSGFGDNDEWNDLGTCHDGLDNNGDGKTDADDVLCQAGGSTEWTLLAGAAQLPGPARPCANGIDDDGDGKTDLDDDTCYNRDTPGESQGDEAPSALITATFDGNFVAVADKATRILYWIDPMLDQLMVPQPGATTPFARASLLDAKQQVRGVTLPGLPESMVPVRLTASLGTPAQVVSMTPIAVALAGAGMVLVRPQLVELDVAGNPTGNTPISIGLVPSAGPFSLPVDASATVPNRPTLLIANQIQEMPVNVPAQYANFGDLTRTTNFGLLVNDQTIEHRTETWSFTQMGILPGGARFGGTWQTVERLYDDRADFCEMGVLPGDWVVTQQPACQGQPAQVVRYAIAEVLPRTLRIDPNSGVLDVPITAANQANWQGKDESAVPAPVIGCYAPSSLKYQVRAKQWLPVGSRTGVLSSRHAAGGQCTSVEFAAAARVMEPQAPGDVSGKSFVPSACPMIGLDANLPATPYVHPMFTAQLLPGCAPQLDATPARLLPPIRDARWQFGLVAGFTPRGSDVGAAPVAAGSGLPLARAYFIDEGQGAIYTIDLASGVRVPSDKVPLQ